MPSKGQKFTCEQVTPSRARGVSRLTDETEESLFRSKAKRDKFADEQTDFASSEAKEDEANLSANGDEKLIFPDRTEASQPRWWRARLKLEPQTPESSTSNFEAEVVRPDSPPEHQTDRASFENGTVEDSVLEVSAPPETSTLNTANGSVADVNGASPNVAPQIVEVPPEESKSDASEAKPDSPREKSVWSKRSGHALTYAGIFLFTFVLYFRPYELFPALRGLDSMALICALATIAVFLPTQLGLEGTLTARPREVNLILLMAACGLFSIFVAQDHAAAWDEFSQKFIKAVVVFIILVNVLRTPARLQWLIYLSLAISLYLSVRAFLDYKAGNVSVDNRVFGAIGGIFENPNDLALHLVTMIPLCLALFFVARNLALKLLFSAIALLLTVGVVVTFSRGGFLGLIGMGAVLAWKLGRRNRLLICGVFALCVVAVLLFAPGNYIGRLATIFHPSGEESAHLRTNLLTLSIKVALRHPVFGVGMGNFPIWSVGSQVTHNAYTQVAAEMGFFAFVCYALFLITPLRELYRIEQNTVEIKHEAKFYYYWSVCLQASLAGYMVSSFFASVAYQWYIYYLVAYAICVRRLYHYGLEESPKSSPESGVWSLESANPQSAGPNPQSESSQSI